MCTISYISCLHTQNAVRNANTGSHITYQSVFFKLHLAYVYWCVYVYVCRFPFFSIRFTIIIRCDTYSYYIIYAKCAISNSWYFNWSMPAYYTLWLDPIHVSAITHSLIYTHTKTHSTYTHIGKKSPTFLLVSINPFFLFFTNEKKVPPSRTIALFFIPLCRIFFNLLGRHWAKLRGITSIGVHKIELHTRYVHFFCCSPITIIW